jgi:PAS domain-containing protein
MQTVAHEVASKELAEHLQPLFDASPDGMYVWLDEEHWVCNQRFADLLGNDSPDELNDTPSFLQRMVHEDDQQHFSWNYWNDVQALAFPRPSGSAGCAGTVRRSRRRPR